MLEFRLPSLGAEMEEGTLLEWKVKPGDAVRKGDVVAVVDTSKSAIDVEIWIEGTIHELLVGPQQKVPVGTVLAILREPGETPEQVAVARAAAPPPGPVSAPPTIAPSPLVPSTQPAAARQRVTPAARARATVLGVGLAAVAGTGPDGAVTLEDVERAAATKPAKADRAAAMRSAIAAAMARSKREIPHYYLATDIVLASALRWLGERNQARPVDERILPAALMLKAVALALARFGDLNGHWRDGAFVPGTGIHVGVAIALRGGGLVAPAIHDVDTLPIDVLMKRLVDLVARARALTLRSSEMTDATITVTNLGDQGVDVVHGVIYPPQVALVGFGRPRERPWITDGRVVATPVVTASLAADHRASDGHRGALFLAEVDRRLQAPEGLDEGSR